MRQKQKMRLSKEKRAMLDTINRTRERAPMPRPTYFRDASKYDRKRQKQMDRKELYYE